MKRTVRGVVLRACRVCSLIVLATFGTVVLARSAPGYFSDVRELDGEHGAGIRQELEQRRQVEGTSVGVWRRYAADLLHGEFGRSKQYGVPVGELLLPRLLVSAKVLLPAYLGGVLFAFACALPCSTLRGLGAQQGVSAVSTLALAVPVGVMATFCLLCNRGGPVLVLFVLVAVRDFRFFTRLLRKQWSMPYLFAARASGLTTSRLVRRHLLGPVWSEIATLFAMSFLLAVNAVLPVEVIFGVAGVGQLAWTAAMNRDLPVLLAVTVLLVVCLGVADLLGGGGEHGEAAA